MCSSLGVQIGAVQSTFGVLGTWTTVFHDEGDPVGMYDFNIFLLPSFFPIHFVLILFCLRGPLWLRKEVDPEESEGWTFSANIVN